MVLDEHVSVGATVAETEQAAALPLPQLGKQILLDDGLGHLPFGIEDD
jgi:hypothetical protein